MHRLGTRGVGALALAAVLLAASCSSSDRGAEPDATAAAPDRELGAPMPASALAEAPDVPTVVVIDASGSMAAQDAPGQRLEAAKTAVGEVLKSLEPGHRLAVVVYGTSTGSSDAEQAAGCQDVVVSTRLGPVDRRDVAQQLSGLQPRGYTPIGLSLQTAADLLPAGGPRAVVVVSDGIDTCAPDGLGPDPCTLAGELHGADQDLAISTIGFRTESDPAAAEQLQCIATAGGGQHLQAANATLLGTRLSASLNAGWSEQALTATSFRGLTLGMSVDEVRDAGGEITGTIRTRGAVEVELADGVTLEFVDGVLGSVEVTTPDVRTIDGLAVGDPLASAEQLYGAGSAGADGDVVVPADAAAGTCFGLGVSGSGTITRIALVRCG